jgi:hypothetical protein
MSTTFFDERFANGESTDQFACQALWALMTSELDAKYFGYPSSPNYTTTHTVKCATYDCSCTLPVLELAPERPFRPDLAGDMTSTIVINGQLWELPAPPLDIRLSISTDEPDTITWGEMQSSDEFWSRGVGAAVSSAFDSLFFSLNGSSVRSTWYMFNETSLEEEAIKRDARCISDESYSWGFSSLLLLTFCINTIAFALALILLQTDVYWNSRHDRDRQSYSIYTDVLYLAEELKNTFGQDIDNHMQSPEAFDKKVEKWKQGLRLDIRELPPSRWQEWRRSRAKKRADRKAKTAPANDTDPPLELRNMSSHNRGGSAMSDTAYHGLIGGDGAESSFEAVPRSDQRSTSGELTQSLASMQRSTGGSVHDDTLLGDPVAESSLLEGDLAGGAGPAEWDSRDRLPRTD